MKKCSSCGQEFDAGFAFCPVCGTKQEIIEEPAEGKKELTENAEENGDKGKDNEQETLESQPFSEANQTSGKSPSSSGPTTAAAPKKSKKLVILLIVIAVLIVMGGGVAFFMVQHQNHLKELEVQRQEAAAEKARIEKERYQAEAERALMEAELEQKRYEEELIAQEKAMANQVLVNEECYISCQEGLYWSFTVPKYSQGIKISCSTSAEFSWKMKFAVVPSYEYANEFCRGRNDYRYMSGTYRDRAQGYSADLKGLEPGHTYYFCAFNDTLGISSASQYKITPYIESY